jgi:hypothetical protein
MKFLNTLQRNLSSFKEKPIELDFEDNTNEKGTSAKYDDLVLSNEHVPCTILEPLKESDFKTPEAKEWFRQKYGTVAE